MRPVVRGPWPINPKTGENRKYTNYSDARGELIERMGEYCSYCERKVVANLAVEHKKPKKQNPQLELVWDNFLLACTNCNSAKKDTDVVLEDYFWPDSDNGLLYFEYLLSGVVTVKDGFNCEIKAKAERTLHLTGLCKREDRTLAQSNRRWKHRKEAYLFAERYYSKTTRKFGGNISDAEWVENVKDLAVEKGHFSIWYTIFQDYPEILQALRAAFPGTADCFDPQTGAPIPRNFPRTDPI